MMGIYRKSVLFQQGGNAVQQEAVLEDAAGQDDRKPSGIERLALISRYTDQGVHEAHRGYAGRYPVPDIIQQTADHRPCVEDPQIILLIKMCFVKCSVRPGCFFRREGFHEGSAFPVVGPS